jgi:hypothetical protein
MPKENDPEGKQDQGGKHGGQAGMPKPVAAPPGTEGNDHDPPRGRVVGNPKVEPRSKPQ